MNEGATSQTRTVPDDWIDYNGHMNLAYYVMAFDQALDVFLHQDIGAGPSLVKSHNQGPFALQSHLHYCDELLAGDAFFCKFLVLDGDTKRLHVAGSMIRQRDGATVCVIEQVLINVDHDTRRSTPYPAQVQARILAILKAHKDIIRPPQIGRPIGLERR